MSLSEEINSFLNQLDVREQLILKRRVWSMGQMSLEGLGIELGLTRERVRQIEKGLYKKLNDVNVSNSIRDEIRIQLLAVDRKSFALTDSDALKLIIANLGFDSFGLNLGDLAHFSKAFEVDAGFLFFPTKQDLAEDLEDIFTTLAPDTAALFADLESERNKQNFCSRLSTSEFRKLQECLGWSHHSIFTYPPRMRSFEQKLYAYLLSQGNAMNLSEVLRIHFSEFSERSSINRIRNSDLFTILDDGLVKIREEGDSQAKTISDLVHEALGAKESVTLEELTQFILSKRKAAKASIRSYASTFPFQLNSGVVSRAEVPRPPQSQIAKTKRLYRIEKGWRLRICLNEEIMRGSSVQLPTSIVGALELPGDARKTFWSEQLGESIWVSWQGMQPKIQALRKAALALGGGANDHMLIDFFLKENQIFFEIVKSPIKKNGLEGVAILLGLSDESNPGPVISKLIMSGANGGLSIIETLQLRKEYDAIEVYEGV